MHFYEGQQHRLAMARALIKYPDFLIQDEPAAVLDSLVGGTETWRCIDGRLKDEQ